MTDGLLIAVLAGLGGMLGWGFADFFAKKTIDKVGDMATLTWAHVYGVVVIISFLYARNSSEGTSLQIPWEAKELVILAFFGVLQAFVYFFVYRAFAKGKLALLNPIFSSYSGLVVILSVIVFGEIIGGWQLASLVVAFLGIVTISLEKDSLRIRKLKLVKIHGIFDILAASLMAAFWTVLWGHFVAGKDWLIYAAIKYVFMSITILLLSFVQRVNLRVLNWHTWKYFFLIGIAEVIAYGAVSIGYSQTSHLSIVAVLSAAFSVPTVILAHVFLRERINNFQILGVILVILGIALVPLL